MSQNIQGFDHTVPRKVYPLQETDIGMQAVAADISNLGLTMIGADEKITFWNHWMERHAGMDADGVLGKRLDEVFPEHINTRIHRSVNIALRSGLRSRMTPVTVRKPLPLYRNSNDRREGRTLRQVIDVIRE